MVSKRRTVYKLSESRVMDVSFIKNVIRECKGYLKDIHQCPKELVIVAEDITEEAKKKWEEFKENIRMYLHHFELSKVLIEGYEYNIKKLSSLIIQGELINEKEQ